MISGRIHLENQLFSIFTKDMSMCVPPNKIAPIFQVSTCYTHLLHAGNRTAFTSFWCVAPTRFELIISTILLSLWQSPGLLTLLNQADSYSHSNSRFVSQLPQCLTSRRFIWYIFLYWCDWDNYHSLWSLSILQTSLASPLSNFQTSFIQMLSFKAGNRKVSGIIN